jgi:hypothetical protein
MILLVAIAVSIAVAFLRGGRLGGLTALSVRWGALAVAAFAIQAFFIYQTPARTTAGAWGWQEFLFVSSYLLLLAVIWVNRHLPGIKLVGLGLLLNFIVIVANGGWMPVTPEALTKVGYAYLAPSLASGTRVRNTKDIILSKQETRLWFLSDIFILSRPFPVPSVCSIGDIVIASGAFLLIQSAMLGDKGQTLLQRN